MASYIYYNYTKKYLLKYKCNHSDAAVVFFAGHDKNRNLDTLQKSRLNKAIELFKSNKVDNIICVGGNRKHQNLHGSRKSADYLFENGIPSEHIFYDMISFDTKTNLQEAYKIADKQGIKSLTYVSDAIHLHRISLFSKNSNYCLNDIDYEFSFLQVIRMANQSFYSFLLEKILSEEDYIKFINYMRD